jgi:hypothetical protein
LEGTRASPTLVRVPVVLSAPCVFPVSVAYETSNFTAVAGQDYQGMSGRLEFPPGVTNLTLDIPVYADALDELQDLFLVNFFAPSNGVLAVAQARCRILDDDPSPLITAGDITLTEGAPDGTKEAVFQFLLSAPSGLTVQIGFATADNTAKAPEDYRTVFGTLVFPPGVTNQSVAVPVRGDRRFEPEETFFL